MHKHDKLLIRSTSAMIIKCGSFILISDEKRNQRIVILHMRTEAQGAL